MTPQELLDKLKAADGPDRELDAEIALTFVPDVQGWVKHPYVKPDWPDWAKAELWPSKEGFLAWRDENADIDNYVSPKFTASLDAIVALVAERLPGWYWDIHSMGGAELRDDIYKPNGIEIIIDNAASPAIALCIALVEAISENG